MLSIGSLVGCLLAGLCMERLGRRITLLVVTSAAYTAGFLAILLAPSAPVIYLGRFLSGLGLGLVLSTATIYIVEIASTDMRGVLGCCIQFMGGGQCSPIMTLMFVDVLRHGIVFTHVYGQGWGSS